MSPFAKNSSTYAHLRSLGAMALILAFLGAVPGGRPLASESAEANSAHAPAHHDGSEEGHSAQKPSLLDGLMPERAKAGHDGLTDATHESEHSPEQSGDHPATDFGAAVEVHHPSATAPAVSVHGDPVMGAQLQHSILPSMFGQAAKNASEEDRSHDLSAIYATLADADAHADPAGLHPMTLADAAATSATLESDDATTTETLAEPLPPDPRVAVNEAVESVLIEKLEIGARRARYLVEFRQIYGPFTKPEDLSQVPGITDSMALEWEKADLVKFD